MQNYCIVKSMGNSDSVMIEVSTRILQILVEEYASAIMPDVEKVYMNDRSMNNEVFGPSTKFHPYGFNPPDDYGRYLCKCAEPLAFSINVSRIVYREEKYIVSILKFLGGCAPKDLFQIKNSIDANYIGVYVGRKILCDELKMKFDAPTYLPNKNTSTYHSRLPKEQLDKMKGSFNQSTMGGPCNDKEKSLKFAQILTSSMGTTQRNIYDDKSKTTITVDKVKKSKIIQYFSDGISHLVEERIKFYRNMCKENSFGKYYEYNNGTLQAVDEVLGRKIENWNKKDKDNEKSTKDNEKSTKDTILECMHAPQFVIADDVNPGDIVNYDNNCV